MTRRSGLLAVILAIAARALAAGGARLSDATPIWDRRTVVRRPRSFCGLLLELRCSLRRRPLCGTFADSRPSRYVNGRRRIGFTMHTNDLELQVGLGVGGRIHR